MSCRRCTNYRANGGGNGPWTCLALPDTAAWLDANVTHDGNPPVSDGCPRFYLRARFRTAGKSNG